MPSLAAQHDPSASRTELVPRQLRLADVAVSFGRCSRHGRVRQPPRLRPDRRRCDESEGPRHERRELRRASISNSTSMPSSASLATGDVAWWIGRHAIGPQIWTIVGGASWQDVLIGDVNGDGRDDIVGSLGQHAVRRTGERRRLRRTSLGRVVGSVKWTDLTLADFHGRRTNGSDRPAAASTVWSRSPPARRSARRMLGANGRRRSIGEHHRARSERRRQRKT